MKVNIFILFLFLLFVSSAVGQSVKIGDNTPITKIDYHLNHLIGELNGNRSIDKKQHAISNYSSRFSLRSKNGDIEVRTLVTVRLGTASGIINRYNLKANVFSGTGVDYILCWVNEIDLTEMSEEDNVLKISPDPIPIPQTDISVPLTNADKIWNGNLLNNENDLITGEGVYIGVIELGMIRGDHDFFMSADNLSRIEYYWDSEIGYLGEDWQGEMYDDSNDNNDHATHVTGIAAGGIGPQGQLGMAPDSRILFGKIQSLGDLLIVVDEMKTYASPNKIVINISLAFYIGGGPHDGNTSWENALNKLIDDNDNLIVVVAAGNYARNVGSHISGAIPDKIDEYYEIELEINEDITNEIFVEIWSENEINIQLGEPDLLNYDYSDLITKTSSHKVFQDYDNSTKDKIQVYFSGVDSELSNYGNETHFISVRFFTDDDLFKKGTYKIRLFPANNGNGGKVDAYHNFILDHTYQKAHFVNGDNNNSITIPGSSKSVITVSSFDKMNENEISDFSSRGGLRGELAPSKPDIAAPGSGGTNAISSASAISADAYIGKQGTSMAAPHVTGGIALIVQNFPELNASDVKELIKITAAPISPNHPPMTYDEVASWGKGKLDVLAAYQYLVGFDGENLLDPLEAYVNTFGEYSTTAGVPLESVQLDWHNSNHSKQQLSGGTLFKNFEQDEVYWIGDEIWNYWETDLGGITSDIGLPISSQFNDEDNHNFSTVEFENCKIFFNSDLNKVVVEDLCTIVNYAYKLSSETSIIQESSTLRIQQVEVFNTEFVVAPPTKTSFFLSVDNHIDNYDYLISEIDIPELAPGEKFVFDFSVDIDQINPRLPPNNYYCGFMIDPLNEVSELSEIDNKYSWNTFEFEVFEEIFDCSSPILLQCGVPYEGNTSNGIYGSSFYGDNNWLENGPEKIHLIHHETTGDLLASVNTNNTSFQENDHDLDIFILSACDPTKLLAYDDKNALLKNAPPGDYYIVVDGYRGDHGSYTLVVNCGNDLPNLTYSLNYNALDVNETSISVSLDVVNQSCSVASQVNDIVFWASSDGVLGEDEDTRLKNVSIPILQPEEHFTVEFDLDIATLNIDNGLYFIGYDIDAYSDVLETEEGDNIYYWSDLDKMVRVTGGGLPNLVWIPFQSKYIVDGSLVKIEGKILNIENVDAGSYSLGVYLSTNRTLDKSNDYLLGEMNFTGLKKGELNSFVFNKDANDSDLGIPPGFYYLIWQVDYKDEVLESIENGTFWIHYDTDRRVSVSESTFCNGTQILSKEFDTFADGSGNKHYNQNTYCQWLIQPEMPTENISLDIINLNLGVGDKLEVFDGWSETSTSLGVFTGSFDPPALVSSSSTMLVRLSGASGGEGFEAEYSANTKALCDTETVFTKPSGTITDGSGCENYLNNTDCEWLILPNNQVSFIKLSFDDFDVADNDYIRIYDGDDIDAPLIAELTNGSILEDYISSSNKMLIRFTSDDSGTRPGFSANFEPHENPDADPDDIPTLITFDSSPNPAGQSLSFNIEFAEEEKFEVLISNIVGQIVYKQAFVGFGANQYVDLSNFASGSYILYVRNSKGRKAKKINILK